ncbi:MAG TPA: hypothetical protein VJT09_03040 [Pyrinomonadaceae bacterium]|nr:hypothetical protein [Pyrinomonadaceae bacterium]
MKDKRISIWCAASVLLLLTVLWDGSAARALNARASDESEVRGVVQMVFEQLKSGRYGELYDVLPAASRSRLSREKFTEALRRSSGMYRLDRIEIGAVRVSGDIAVVDTVMYGNVERPVQAEGKIVAQQYLVREDGRWRVATGDRATVRRFLSSNPAFAKKFPIRDPRIFVKRDGRWVDLSGALRATTRRAS